MLFVIGGNPDTGGTGLFVTIAGAGAGVLGSSPMGLAVVVIVEDDEGTGVA